MRTLTLNTIKKSDAVFAAFSFTLYVIHLPLIFAARDLLHLTDATQLSRQSLSDFLTYIALLAATICVAYLLHLPFEAQGARVPTRLKALLLESALRGQLRQGSGHAG